MSKKKNTALIVMPTFNESENIAFMLDSIYAVTDEVDVLVVDDESPDGTSRIVAEYAKKNPKVHLLTKTTDKGFARAYISGLNWGVEQGYKKLLQMDADGSHQPKFLPSMLAASEEANFVIGSRWTKGGSVVNWPFRRLLLSRGGNLYTRIMLGTKVKDITGGFKVIDAELLKKIDVSTIAVKGYSFQIEIALRALANGANIKEVPIEFLERINGVSKMSSTIVKEAMLFVTAKGLSKLAGKTF